MTHPNHRFRQRFLRGIGFLLICVLLAGCGADPSSAPTPSPSGEVQETAAPTPSPSPSGEVQESAAPTPSPEPTVDAFESKWSVGSTVTFGTYEQDNNTENGKEAIWWRVLAREGDKALLISVDNLDSQAYNKRSTSITWENCTLRTWLNDNFFHTAFTPAQQEAILTTAVVNEDNPTHGTDGGKDTSDKVFLLSTTEAENLFRDDDDRTAKSSAYAIAQGMYTSDNGVIAQGTYLSDNATGWWWLRSPGAYDAVAAHVDFDGSIYRDGTFVEYLSFGVRPALWLDLTSDNVTSATP